MLSGVIGGLGAAGTAVGAAAASAAGAVGDAAGAAAAAAAGAVTSGAILAGGLTLGGVLFLQSPAGPANELPPNYFSHPPVINNGDKKKGSGANRNRSGGDDPLYKMSCDDLWEAYNNACGAEKTKINTILKLKGCKGSSMGGGATR